MNKDMDERLVPPTEYRDALNIEVNTSEGSNVGTVQTILGNTALTSIFPAGSTCVGSIADTKTDKIYWFVAGPKNGESITHDDDFTLTVWKDYIIEYDVQEEDYKYVLVDIYKVRAACTNDGHGSAEHLHIIDGGTNVNITGIRRGMKVTGTFTNNSGATFIAPNGNSIAAGAMYAVSMNDNVTVTDIQKDTGTSPTDWRIYTSTPIHHEADDIATFKSKRLLSFEGAYGTTPTRYITGINVLDGMLFWTDDYSEPKKINIERCIVGTGGTERLVGASDVGDPLTTAGVVDTTTTSNIFEQITTNGVTTDRTDHFHTRLVSSIDGVNLEVMTDRLKQKAVWLEEEHITVLKKAPLTPPYLEMSNQEPERTDSSGNPTIISTTLTSFGFSNASGLLPVDGTIWNGLIFNDSVDYRIGDIIILTNDADADPTSFVDAKVRIRIEGLITPGSSPPVSINPPATGEYYWSVLSIDSTIGTGLQNWTARLLQSKAMFESKFPRFAYRYKYKDGEYSTFSPFSEIAFLPGNYNYASKQGYNLGMINQLRSLKITDYIVEDSARGRDVVEVDILFKNEDSPNIYTIKTIKPTDDYKIVNGSATYTGNWPDLENHAYDRGEYEVETELIHGVLPSDQLIRPWDNVPIKAKAQDITANRLIYGNYVQNYDIINEIGGEVITPDIQVSLESTLGDLANGVANSEPVPSKSVKSLRTYQVGVVYRDIYGRETPVLAGNAVDSTIEVNKDECLSFNKIKATIKSPAPYWADSWKFFIKETSNEYYSLAMDRWYNAEDGNIWISFPSAERNKVQDDSFLILKKQHKTDIPVTDEARYKVIAIEDEAPEYIKRNTKKLGSEGGGIISTSASGFPYIDFSSFKVNSSQFKDEFLTADQGSATGDSTPDVYLREAMHSGFLFVRIGSGSVKSNYYKVANIVEAANGMSKISLDGKLGEDVRFASPTQDAAGQVSGMFLELVTRIPESRPEFDGRFFVKVIKDLILQENILNKGNSSEDYSVTNAVSMKYVNYGSVTDGLSNSLLVTGNNTTSPTYRIFSAFGSTDANIVDFYYDDNGSGWPSLNSFSNGYETGWAVQAWWRSFRTGSPSWFIDSAITVNELETNLSNSTNSGLLGQISNDPFNTANRHPAIPAQSDIADGTHGIYQAELNLQFDPNYYTDSNSSGPDPQISGVGTCMSISFSGIYSVLPANTSTVPLYDNQNSLFSGGGGPFSFMFQTFDVGGVANPGQADTVSNISQVGIKFRFTDDPAKTIYTIRHVKRIENRYNYSGHNSFWSGLGGSTFGEAANKRLTFKIIVTDDNGLGIGVGGGYDPTTSDTSGAAAWTAATSGTGVRMEFLEAFDSDDNQFISDNPAVWETEPKEDVGLDIYYEATPAYPLSIDYRTNEQFVKYGSVAINETAIANDLINGTTLSWTGTIKVQSWSGMRVTLDTVIPQDVAVGDVISFTAPDGGVTRLVVKTAIDVSTTTTQGITFENTPHEQTVTLPYSNCFAFGNGVESNRIRDDYNEIYIRNGVKASTVLAKHYEQERRSAGLIHSGIYNSTSGTNNLNQFIQGNPITKDLNPRHGSIQVLANRGSDLVAITEDKCFKILADKDALFNADGSAQLIASNKVLGQATPYTGDFGTTNPESFAQDNFRAYFVDRTRGKVCRLSMDGITPISSAGMHDWFGDNLQVQNGVRLNTIIGSFDSNKSLYNATINQTIYSTNWSNYFAQYDSPYTLSYSETAKGWVSFKSFHPESGLSINNDYYTFKDGELWKHHTNETRNNFYGVQYDSSVTTILNDQPESIKSFNTLNYEGSQAKITQWKDTTNMATDGSNTEWFDGAGTVSQADGEYYNLNTKTGWYVDSFETNEQSATIPEFIEKEGKWFNYIRGVATTHVNDSESLAITSSNLDQQEFSVQGIGVAATITSDGEGADQYKLTISNNTSTTYKKDMLPDGSGGTGDVWDSTAD